jgi:hypothetical protein
VPSFEGGTQQIGRATHVWRILWKLLDIYMMVESGERFQRLGKEVMAKENDWKY